MVPQSVTDLVKTQHRKKKSILPWKDRSLFLFKNLPGLRYLSQLKEEIALLTTYSSDTIYRLRYDTMTYDYISPAITQLLGYSLEEMKQINFRSLILETRVIADSIRSIHSFREYEENRLHGKVNKWQADYLVLTKGGKKIWISDISNPWFNNKGELVGSIGCLRDITERVHAEHLAKEELMRLAHTDPLTGLANRRRFFEKIEEELKRVQRSKNEFSVMILDVDHFKKINDSYGHDVGDKILQEIARILKSSLRETDLIARLGGEEFGLFLPDTPCKGAYFAADRVCMAIAKHGFVVPGLNQPIGCTVSIGVASSAMLDQRDPTKLYKLADTHLYVAKNTGRNQVFADEVPYMLH